MVNDRKIAEELSHQLLDISGAINDAVVLVKDNCPADEFNAFRRAMARLLDHLYTLGLEPLYEAHPDIAPPELEFKPRRKGR